MKLALSKEMDPGAERRLVEGWRDGEVTIAVLVQRFRLSPRDVELLKAQLGPKTRLGPSSHQSLCYAIRARAR